MRKYGLPYMGSKSRIASKIVNLLPPSEKLYDVFAGGCAITHAALLSGKWDTVIANDIFDAPKLFEDALNGKYRNEKRWISREDFIKYKDTDPYIRICWSFGNNQRNYLYSRQIEPWKKALHYARVLGDNSLLREMGIESDGSSADIRAHHEEYKAKYCQYAEAENIKHKRLYELQSLESLERLQSLESLERLQSYPPSQLQTYMLDYRDIEISGDAVIYCDPPYIGAEGYNITFDHEAFCDWCCEQTTPIYISEYSMPEDRFECVAEFDLISTLSSTNNNKRTKERIFRPKTQLI